MTVTTLDPSTRMSVAFYTSNTLSGVKLHAKDSGKLAVSGLRIFRSGTFKDSMGESHTWEALHMEQLVAHFNMLRASDLFPNVPVREGHPSLFGGGGALKGYVTSLATATGTDPTGAPSTFLEADFEFTEPDGAEKFQRGTYRARSAEIGFYETNSEAMFWPVLMGFAFVDIGAVEGLYENPQTKQKFTFIKENPVVDEVVTTPPVPTAPVPPVVVPAVTHAAPTPTPPAPAPSFKLFGREISDLSEVQKHISTLEQFQHETEQKIREDFVKELASGSNPKITAAQIDPMVVFTKSLSPEQFAQYRTSWDVAPVSPLLAQHSTNQSTTPPITGEVSEAEDRLSIARETVAMHRRAGMPQVQLEQTESWKTLQNAQKTN